MPLKYPAMVALDLDGTLVDTVPDLSQSIHNMLRKLLLPEASEAKVRAWVGDGIEQLVKRALSNGLAQPPEATLFKHALSIFLNEYEQNTCKQSQLYQGVKEGLNYLVKQQFKLACITNKASRFTNIILKRLDIHDQFGIVISGDTLPSKKPDPLPLLHAAQYFSVQPDESLMVGDSINDISAARAAGFQVLCVDYGYNSGRDIKLDQPDWIVNSLAEIANAF